MASRKASASTKRRARRKRPRRKKSRSVGASLALIVRYGASAGVVVLTGLLCLAAVVAVYARDLPETESLWAPERAPRVTLLAIDGSPIVVNGQSGGGPVRLADLPPHVALAVLAVEDRNFHHHIGVNPLSVGRALFVNASAGKVRQGGSTITQQLAKNLFLTPERTMERKIEELMLALWLEMKFTKDEILTLYLNRVYFGAGAYGVDAASRRYFAKPARNLTVGEAAVLAGLLKAPTRLSPSRNPKDAGLRARAVVDAMEAAKYLTPAQAEKARREPVVLAAARLAGAPHFVDYVLQEARRLAAGIDADIIVQTTYDPQAQRALERGLAAGLLLSPLPEDVEAAAVILDAEGAVHAMIGGRDYRGSQFNRATQAERQPGSAFKPFVYLAALEAGYEPSDLVEDAPIAIEGWRPDNYAGRYWGEVTLEDALAHSLNGATIRVQETVGRSAVRLAARRMGLRSSHSRGASLALGVDAVTPLELAAAYAPLANGGFRTEAHAIDSIRTTDGETIYRRDPAMRDAAASFRNIERLNAMLAAVIARGTGRAAAIPGRRAVGKTGTTQGSRDGWFAGHAGGYVCVIWIGRDDNAPVEGLAGGGAPAIIWREAMTRALAAREQERAAPPVATPIAATLGADPS